MTEAGIGCGFEDEVGSFVGGVTRGVESVKQTAALAWCVQEKVASNGSGRSRGDNGRGRRSRVDGGDGRESTAADGGLRPFDRHAQIKLVAKVLDRAESGLTSPGEAHDVLRVDHLRQVFLAVGFALLVFCGERPHLAAGDVPAILEQSFRIRLALTENVAV